MDVGVLPLMWFEAYRNHRRPKMKCGWRSQRRWKRRNPGEEKDQREEANQGWRTGRPFGDQKNDPRRSTERGDGPAGHVALLTFQKMDPWKKVMKRAEGAEQEILQTKIVSPQELVKDVHLWDEAIKAELDALLNAKEALRKITSEEKARLEERHPDLLVVPSKLVITRKAGGRRKVRIVACGNYVEKTEKEDVFASGSDSISFRIALKKSLDEGWSGATADIRTAFLNAPLGRSAEALEGLWKKEELEELGQEVVVVLVKPPALLIKLGYISPEDWWVAVKAVYGLRQSPKAWGDHRDSKMSMMEWGCQGGIRALVQSTTDPNVWKILKRSGGLDEEMEGLCVVYVDDLMVLSQEHIVKECLERISREWEISTPEWLNEVKPVKFLGMEVLMGTKSAFITQESYVQDLLRRNGAPTLCLARSMSFMGHASVRIV